MSELETLGPIDRTPGIPGSDKNLSTQALKDYFALAESQPTPGTLIIISNRTQQHGVICQCGVCDQSQMMALREGVVWGGSFCHVPTTFDFLCYQYTQDI